MKSLFSLCVFILSIVALINITNDLLWLLSWLTLGFSFAYLVYAFYNTFGELGVAILALITSFFE